MLRLESEPGATPCLSEALAFLLRCRCRMDVCLPGPAVHAPGDGAQVLCS